VELITLGTSAAHPTVERACSGFLIRQGDTRLMIEAGSGAIRNLMRWQDPLALDAIIVTHLHQDHFIDLYPLYYYLVFHRGERLPLTVYAPDGMREFYLRIMHPGAEKEIDDVYRFESLNDNPAFTVGGLQCGSMPVKHSIPAFGIRVQGQGIIAYSSDTDYDDVLIGLAAGCDIFICEATMQREWENLKHLTATEAGIIAQKAEVGNLVLTHIWPDFDPFESQRMAALEFDGPVIVAEDNMRIAVEG